MGTVSIVLVSHSRQLAEGVRELAAQMTQGKVKIAVAGGTADGRLGTDATAILGAIEEVRGPEGVLILVDLGSAVLSTQIAMEQLSNSGGRVLLSNAPFVEGAVIAAVEASIDSDLDGVAAAAPSLPTSEGIFHCRSRSTTCHCRTAVVSVRTSSSSAPPRIGVPRLSPSS